MQPRSARIDFAKQLLVEGRNEEFFFRAFLRHLAVEGVQVQPYNGRDNLANFLRELADLAEFEMVESIGIVRDADNSAHSALQSVQSSLRNLGLPAPTVFRESAGTLPKVSIFVMPDNEHAGALEQLCLQALVDDPVMPCVAGFLQCVERLSLIHI